jgi:3-phosphoglycerate kinase
MAIKYLRATNPKLLAGTALLRLDFNTEDDWRMRAVLPTIKLLLKTSSHIVIVSHHGRPVGVDKKLSLKKNAAALSKMLHRKVIFVPHFRFGEIRTTVHSAPRDSIFLLENLRFLKGEEENSPVLGKQLASLADFYVNDAFAVSHRANASVVAVTKFLPSYAGLELQTEIESLSRAMVRPKRPLVLILGGAKAADKLGVITYFKKKADWFLLGGGPANTILALRGMDIKKSVKDTDPRDVAKMKELSKYKNVIVPQDVVWHNGAILDLGPKSIKNFAAKIAQAGTILWSGPIGLIEKKAFTRGSIALVRAIAKNKSAFSIAGGGETVMFLKKYKLDRKFSFVSTGGGAMIDFLAGKKLPGIEALR